jgi:hypothetical protein
MRVRRLGERAAGLYLGLALLAGRATAAEGLALDPKDSRFSGRPDLVATLTATPHGYFRFVNAGFAASAAPLSAAAAIVRVIRSTLAKGRAAS